MSRSKYHGQEVMLFMDAWKGIKPKTLCRRNTFKYNKLPKEKRNFGIVFSSA